MLKFDAFPVGPISATCILVWDPAQGTGVVVDPGGDADRIRQRVEKAGYQVQAILQTHAHFDHLGAARLLQDQWHCPVHLHPSDRFLVEDLEAQVQMLGMDPILPPVTTALGHGEVHHGLRVLHTPGHTPGSCCLLGTFEQGEIVLSGDTLFQGSVGRTDLWGGDHGRLLESIARELYVLDDATHVIPGHGPTTTIGREAKSNPFVRR